MLLVGIWLGGSSELAAITAALLVRGRREGRLVHEALDLLARDYYRPINRNQLVDKGLAAAIASLNDPYSHYFSPSDYQAFLNQSNPHLSGVGIDVLPDPRVACGSPTCSRARRPRAPG